MTAVVQEWLLHPQALGFEAGTSQQRSTELILPDKDASGLAAYLQLFTRVFSNASLSDTEAWVAELEGSIQVQHLWDLFFQLMCHPVPQVRMAVVLPSTAECSLASSFWPP
jgi:hypothetical protein